MAPQGDRCPVNRRKPIGRAARSNRSRVQPRRDSGIRVFAGSRVARRGDALVSVTMWRRKGREDLWNSFGRRNRFTTTDRNSLIWLDCCSVRALRSASPQSIGPIGQRHHDKQQAGRHHESFVGHRSQPSSAPGGQQHPRSGDDRRDGEQAAGGVGLEGPHPMPPHHVRPRRRHAARRTSHVEQDAERARRQPKLPMGSEPVRIRAQGRGHHQQRDEHGARRRQQEPLTPTQSVFGGSSHGTLHDKGAGGYWFVHGFARPIQQQATTGKSGI